MVSHADRYCTPSQKKVSGHEMTNICNHLQTIDPYENFYMMIEGSKTFTIFPPVECYCMHEAEYRSSQYLWDESEHAWKIVSKTQGEEQMQVPWIPVDPLEPNYAKHPRFRFARSMSVQLDQGDLLYLPSLWYHHVQAHRTSPNGLVIACNWW
jgi:jumonji domain-containing protein 7